MPLRDKETQKKTQKISAPETGTKRKQPQIARKKASQTQTPDAQARYQSLSSVRLLSIMECLSKQHDYVRLTDLSAKLKMTQPTLLRYLSALILTGYAFQEPGGGGYMLSRKVCAISNNLQAGVSLRSLAEPFLKQLSELLHLGVLLATEMNGDVVYLDMLMSATSSMQTLIRIGKDAPIHSTASGKVLLSKHSEAEIHAMIQEKGLPRLTEHTITDEKKLISEIMKVGKCGYALDNEECEIGHRCISVPLYDYSGKIVAAISAFDDTDALTDTRIKEQVLPAMKKLSGQLSALLGWEEAL